MPYHRYPKQCYIMLKGLDDSGRKCWASEVKTMLFRYGYGHVWISQEIGDVNLFIRHFRQRIINCYTQNWQSDKSNSSRCHPSGGGNPDSSIAQMAPCATHMKDIREI